MDRSLKVRVANLFAEPLAWVLVLWLAYVCCATPMRLQHFEAASRNDDPYITYRYAERLAQGYGFQLNEGERVLGTTTPLYTFILAGAKVVLPTTDIVSISIILNHTFHALAVLGLMLVLMEVLGRKLMPTLISSIFFVTTCYLSEPLATLMFGMEIGLIHFLLAGSVVFLYAKRSVALAFFLFLLVFTRIDAVIFVAITLLFAFFYLWREPLWSRFKAALLFGSLVGAYVASFTAYFGSVVPNSVKAKNIYFRIYGANGLPAERYVDSLFKELIGASNADAALLVLCAVGIVSAIICRKFTVVLLGVSFAAYFLFIGLYKVCLNFNWYIPQYMLFYYAAGAFGFQMILSLLGRLLDRVIGVRWIGTATQLILTLVFIAFVTPPSLGRLKLREANLNANFPPSDSLMFLGKYLRQLNVPKDQVVAIGDIGKVAYYSGARILDIVGLVSPQVFKYYLDGSGIAGVIQGERPDYVLVHQAYLPKTSAEKDQQFNSWFKEYYQFIINGAGEQIESGYCMYRKRAIQ